MTPVLHLFGLGIAAFTSFGAVPCANQRGQFSLVDANAAKEIVVGKHLGDLRISQHRDGEQVISLEHHTYDVELVIRGRIRAGTRIEVLRKRDPWMSGMTSPGDIQDLRGILFLEPEGKAYCFSTQDSGIRITTGRHDRPVNAASDLADVVTDLILTPGMGYREERFNVQAAIGTAVAWQRVNKAFSRGRELLNSQKRAVRMNACISMVADFEVLPKCLDEFSDADQDDPSKGHTIAGLRIARGLLPERLRLYLEQLEKPEGYQSMSAYRRRTTLERVEIIANYAEPAVTRARAEATLRNLRSK